MPDLWCGVRQLSGDEKGEFVVWGGGGGHGVAGWLGRLGSVVKAAWKQMGGLLLVLGLDITSGHHLDNYEGSAMHPCR